MRIVPLSIIFVGAISLAYAAATHWPRGGGPGEVFPATTSSAPPAARVSRYSGLPLPRFVSVKTSKVNVRRGPSRQHPIAWSYTRRGLPVEIISETENWRQIRDSEGSEGWVYHGLLSGARSVVISPWDGRSIRQLHDRPDATSSIRARFESGVIASVKSCTGAWCRVESGGHDGWIAQDKVWGVYLGETVN